MLWMTAQTREKKRPKHNNMREVRYRSRAFSEELSHCWPSFSPGYTTGRLNQCLRGSLIRHKETQKHRVTYSSASHIGGCNNKMRHVEGHKGKSKKKNPKKTTKKPREDIPVHGERSDYQRAKLILNTSRWRAQHANRHTVHLILKISLKKRV